ncbi:MAG: HD domain-containing protein [Clostridiales bacterium]|nr:HD domain-containing protein [Clostridiales bacterium]
MLDKIDERFEVIKSRFVQNGYSTHKIERAFELARLLHRDQRRLDGQLYITHPLEVAIILSNLDFDEDVVCGALLHDVVEDCNYTTKEIEQHFGKNVASMVDCVSAIDKEEYVFNTDDIYEDQNFQKASIEEQSFKKLIALGKQNPLGFCIKFADRLHNLRTIASFPFAKQLEKVKETEKWIIPIAKALNSEYFYRTIKNECFKLVHNQEISEYLWQYNNYHSSNVQIIKKIEGKLQEVCLNSSITSLHIIPVREYKVYEDLNKMFKNINIRKISQGQMLKVATYNIHLVYEKGEFQDVLAEVFSLIEHKLSGQVKLIDANVGSFTKKPYIQIEDRFKNKYNVYVLNKSENISLRNGTLDGQNSYMLDEEDVGSLGQDFIHVKTRSGEIKFIHKDNTVLDFAFKLHRDIGLGFQYAIINGSKTKSPPYTRLFDGDQVDIVVARDENNEIKNNANLKWFAYVSSDLAKKCLIKEFEKQMKN